MTFNRYVTASEDRIPQTCAGCLRLIRRGAERLTVTYVWSDGAVRRFHYHPEHAPAAGTAGRS